MGFEEIRSTVSKVYDELKLPHFEVASSPGRIQRLSILGPDCLSKEKNSFECQMAIKERLASRKKIGEMSKLNKWYWDYATELYNKHNGALDSFISLFTNRIQEFTKAYYIETENLMGFFLCDFRGKRIYQQYPKAYATLVSDLCYKNIFHFEDRFKNHKEIYNEFKDYSIEGKPSLVYDYDQDEYRRMTEHEYAIMHSKEIVIRLADLKQKAQSINSILDRVLFDPSKPFLASMKKWDEHTNNEKKEIERITSESNKRPGAPYDADTPQEEIERIVNELFDKYKRGEMILTNLNGQKKMYKVVHENDNHNKIGKANVNQIFEYFQYAHPELINIQKRWFKERIKKALPNDMR